MNLILVKRTCYRLRHFTSQNKKVEKQNTTLFAHKQRIAVTFPNSVACICSRTSASRNRLSFPYQVIKPCLSKVIVFEIGQLERSQCRFQIQTFTICENVTHRLIVRRPRGSRQEQEEMAEGTLGGSERKIVALMEMPNASVWIENSTTNKKKPPL